MHPTVREKLNELSEALETPAAPKDIYDAEAIAALIVRFTKALKAENFVTSEYSLLYATALLEALRQPATSALAEDVRSRLINIARRNGTTGIS